MDETTQILKSIDTTGEHSLLESHNTTEAVKSLEAPLEGALLKLDEISKNTSKETVQKIQIVASPSNIDLDDPEGDRKRGVALMKMIRGPKGHTPILGVDYFKPGEKEELVNEILPKVTPTIGRDYYTEEQQKKLADEILSKVRVPLDGFTPIKGVDYKDGEPGLDGEDADEEAIEQRVTEKVLPLIPTAKEVAKFVPKAKDGSPDKPKEIVEKLHSLPKGERLSYEKLDDLPNLDTFRRQSSKTVSLSELDDVDLSALKTSKGKYILSSGDGTGSVTKVSIVSANGFAGDVTNDSTIPTITIKTSVSGLLKGDGTGVSAAVNTDLPVGDATHSGAMPTPPNDVSQVLRGDATFGPAAASFNPTQWVMTYNGTMKYITTYTASVSDSLGVTENKTVTKS